MGGARSYAAQDADDLVSDVLDVEPAPEERAPYDQLGRLAITAAGRPPTGASRPPTGASRPPTGASRPLAASG